METWEQIWRRLREVFTEEEINNLIIYEQERERLRQEQERRPELQIPLEPPPPYYEEDEEASEESQRGVVIIDI